MQRERSGRSDVARTSHNGTEPEQRARQRALCVGALAEGDDLQELGELLRTAGVGVVGELVQHREAPHPPASSGPTPRIEWVRKLMLMALMPR